MGLEQLLESHKFFRHPFTTYIAEDEKDLINWYIDPPYLKRLAGTEGKRTLPLTPKSSLIFGDRGAGKTALRLRLETLISERADTPLIIRYIDFERILSYGVTPRLHEHIDELIRLGTIEILGFWHTNPKSYDKLSLEEKGELAGLVFEYWNNLPPATKRRYVQELSPVSGRITQFAKTGGRTLVSLYNNLISVFNKEKLQPTDWKAESSTQNYQGAYSRLERFWYLVQSLGIKSVWVMIDSIDEAGELRKSQQIFDFLKTLLLHQRVFEFRQDNLQRICFKVFLTKPTEMEPLFDGAEFRRDRVDVVHLDWRREELNSALSHRLSYFSNNRILSFDELCEEGVDNAQSQLLDSAKLRPRSLFRIAREVLEEFDRRSKPQANKIDAQSLAFGIEIGAKQQMD